MMKTFEIKIVIKDVETGDVHSNISTVHTAFDDILFTKKGEPYLAPHERPWGSHAPQQRLIDDFLHTTRDFLLDWFKAVRI